MLARTWASGVGVVPKVRQLSLRRARGYLLTCRIAAALRGSALRLLRVRNLEVLWHQGPVHAQRQEVPPHQILDLAEPQIEVVMRQSVAVHIRKLDVAALAVWHQMDPLVG
jgi:hypothetical protein